jgi:hypothetical protein
MIQMMQNTLPGILRSRLTSYQVSTVYVKDGTPTRVKENSEIKIAMAASTGHLSLQDALDSSRGPLFDCTRNNADVLPPSDCHGLHIVFKSVLLFPITVQACEADGNCDENYMPLLGHLIVIKTSRGIDLCIGGMEDAINTVDFRVRYHLLSINHYSLFHFASHVSNILQT